MLKSVNGIVCYVKDAVKTAEFYRALGFDIEEATKDKVSIELGEFWCDFHAQDTEDKSDFKDEAHVTPKGGGLYLYTEVEDVDTYYKSLLEKGLKPANEPKDWPWGNREFLIRDPDGYKLVFYKEIGN